MTFEPIEHDRDDYGPDDAPARPSAGRTGALWRRFWRSLTGQRTGAETWRPAVAYEADDDTRAVRALTNAASRMLGMWAEANDDIRRELWTTLHDRADDVHDRYRERYAALDEKACEQL